MDKYIETSVGELTDSGFIQARYCNNWGLKLKGVAVSEILIWRRTFKSCNYQNISRTNRLTRLIIISQHCFARLMLTDHFMLFPYPKLPSFHWDLCFSTCSLSFHIKGFYWAIYKVCMVDGSGDNDRVFAGTGDRWLQIKRTTIFSSSVLSYLCVSILNSYSNHILSWWVTLCHEQWWRTNSSKESKQQMPIMLFIKSTGRC